jgi:hypothetical protein
MPPLETLPDEGQEKARGKCETAAEAFARPRYGRQYTFYRERKIARTRRRNLCPEGLREFLAAHDVEGVVFHHPDGRKAKIKKRDFGLKR